MDIRDATPSPEIAALIARAFAGKAYADGDEPELPARLARDGDLALSLAAFDGDALLGHVALSPARIGTRDDWLALGPIAVEPEQQKRGIGAALIEAAADRAGAMTPAVAGIVLIGDPGYYTLHGFEADRGLTWRDVPTSYVQRRLLHGPDATGEITFAPAFG